MNEVLRHLSFCAMLTFSPSMLTSLCGDTPSTWFRWYSLQSFITSPQLSNLNIKSMFPWKDQQQSLRPPSGSLLMGPRTISKPCMRWVHLTDQLDVVAIPGEGNWSQGCITLHHHIRQCKKKEVVKGGKDEQEANSICICRHSSTYIYER